jgi:hypothetical protein
MGDEEQHKAKQKKQLENKYYKETNKPVPVAARSKA